MNYICFSDEATLSTCDWTDAFSGAHDKKRQIRLRNRIYIAIEQKITGDLNDTRAIYSTLNLSIEIKETVSGTCPDKLSRLSKYVRVCALFLQIFSPSKLISLDKLVSTRTYRGLKYFFSHNNII